MRTEVATPIHSKYDMTTITGAGNSSQLTSGGPDPFRNRNRTTQPETVHAPRCTTGLFLNAAIHKVKIREEDSFS